MPGAIRQPLDVLSGAQRRLMPFLVAGRTNAEIAAALGLSPETVKWHISQALSVAGLQRRDQLADWWRTGHGLPPRLTANGAPQRHNGNGGRTVSGPIISSESSAAFAAAGASLVIQEWRGSAPGELHRHHFDDVAWHVLDGRLKFRFADRTAEFGAGTTIYMPAGTAHTYGEGESARYLVIGPPRVFELFEALRAARVSRPHTDWGNGPDRDIYRAHEAELLD
jgi:DNA-binding CsgD family transcriptional regulator/mannose-6-phosphate isomerase-like protein (cupin superfamily)